MATVFLALGSNLGDRENYIQKALTELELIGITIIQKSSIMETKPEGGPPQNKYLNEVIKVQTELSPHMLLQKLKNIEKKLGRIKTVKNGPRTIDLDILIYDNIQVQSNELIIPHPRMKNRDFVMIPLQEIAPEIIKDISDARY